jgi:hypothetical protein
VQSARVLKKGGYEAQGDKCGPFSAATEEVIVEKSPRTRSADRGELKLAIPLRSFYSWTMAHWQVRE